MSVYTAAENPVTVNGYFLSEYIEETSSSNDLTAIIGKLLFILW